MDECRTSSYYRVRSLVRRGPKRLRHLPMSAGAAAQAESPTEEFVRRSHLWTSNQHRKLIIASINWMNDRWPRNIMNQPLYHLRPVVHPLVLDILDLQVRRPLDVFNLIMGKLTAKAREMTCEFCYWSIVCIIFNKIFIFSCKTCISKNELFKLATLGIA